jgi:fructose-1-phosphate kinase PfkB-like protein
MVTNGQVKAWQYEDYPACSLTKPLASVTGAGDSLVAGMVAALVEQRYTSCVAIGLKAAQLSLQSAEAIAADLKPDILATT